jgi:hypothetical protein
VDALISIRQPFRVIVGDAKDGADPMFWAAAEKLQLPRHRFKARWKTFGRAAGHLRNAWMVVWLEKISNGTEDSCIVLAAWDGKSPGTKDCMDAAKDVGFDVWRISGKGVMR